MHTRKAWKEGGVSILCTRDYTQGIENLSLIPYKEDYKDVEITRY
jgi:hypothetical protein